MVTGKSVLIDFNARLIIVVLIVCVSACHASVPEEKNVETRSASTEIQESRKKGGMGNNQWLQRILPMLVTPFMWSTMMLPMAILGMKFMLIQAIFLGKLAIFFGIANLVKTNLKNKGGLYSHNVFVKSSENHHRRNDNLTDITMVNQNFHDNYTVHT